MLTTTTETKLKSLRDKIYESIRESIAQGSIHPGERLIETDLAQQFKSSRSPIREALRQLESESLIRSENNKGYTVAKLSPKDVDEIYSVRIILESYATGLTAGFITKKDIRYLEKLNDQLKTAARENDLKVWLENNSLFHRFFFENCKNNTLSFLLQTLQRRIHRYLYMIIQIPGNFPAYLEQHQGILEGCRQGDPSAAERHMRAHLETVREITLNYLHHFPGI
jgi:DNA-binding GntR family transcriptional regulator